MLTFSDKSRMLEHRFVAEKKLGRKLQISEIVHHKDRNWKNNHPDNLEVLSWNAHGFLHSKEKRPKTFLILNCPQCNKNFPKDARRVRCDKKNGTVNFCSRKCSGRYSSDKYWGVV